MWEMGVLLHSLELEAVFSLLIHTAVKYPLICACSTYMELSAIREFVTYCAHDAYKCNLYRYTVYFYV